MLMSQLRNLFMGIPRICNLIFKFCLWVHSFTECHETLLIFLVACEKIYVM